MNYNERATTLLSTQLFSTFYRKKWAKNEWVLSIYSKLRVTENIVTNQIITRKGIYQWESLRKNITNQHSLALSRDRLISSEKTWAPPFGIGTCFRVQNIGKRYRIGEFIHEGIEVVGASPIVLRNSRLKLIVYGCRAVWDGWTAIEARCWNWILSDDWRVILARWWMLVSTFLWHGFGDIIDLLSNCKVKYLTFTT